MIWDVVTRATVGAATLVAALSVAGSAPASLVPTFVVGLDEPTLGGRGPMTFYVNMERKNDDPLAHATLYVPRGFKAPLSQPFGKTIGYATALETAGDLGDSALPLEGHVEVADPSTFVAPPANTCAVGQHRAVWMLALSGGGQELRIPMYVDPARGAAPSFAAYQIQFCLPPPDVPPGTPGRAPQGAQVEVLFFSVNSVFRNPLTPGQYVFSGVFTPFVTGTALANTAGAVESRSVHRLPGRLSLSATRVTRAKTVDGRNVKTYFARLSGALTEDRKGVSGNVVRLVGAGTVTTRAGGKFTKLVPIKRTTYFTAAARVGQLGNDRDFTSVGCAKPPSIAPAGCVRATLWNFNVASRTVKLTVP